MANKCGSKNKNVGADEKYCFTKQIIASCKLQWISLLPIIVAPGKPASE